MYKYIHKPTRNQYSFIDYTFIDTTKYNLHFILDMYLKSIKDNKHIDKPSYIVVNTSYDKTFINNLKASGWEIKYTSELVNGVFIKPNTVLIADSQQLTECISPSQNEYILAVVDHRDRNIVPRLTTLTFILYLEIKGKK